MKKEVILERVTNVVAGAGVTYPAWEQNLIHAGEIAEALVPMLSAAWLILQIVGYARKRWAR